MCLVEDNFSTMITPQEFREANTFKEILGYYFD